MKPHNSIVGIILSGLLLIAFIACKKEPPKVIPTVTLTAATNITAISSMSGGFVTADGGDPVTARGVCWSSTNATPTTADSKTSDGTGTGSFSSSLSGLTQGTTYNIRAYATNSVGTGYSSASTFKTLALAPTLTTTDASAVTATSFSSGGNITNDGGSQVTARGVCWGINQNPSITDSKTSDGTGTGIFNSTVTGLTAGTNYYVRAYATNSIGTTYGNQVTTKTLAVLPTLSTTTATSITSTSASSGGNITSDGGATITARGVCWGTTSSPTITGNKTSDNTGTGSFTSSISGLSANTTYYIRAYATNSAGTAYGNMVTVTTTNTPTGLADVYYGKIDSDVPDFMPTAAYIKANFSRATGEVGGLYPAPRVYNFAASVEQQVYFVYRDLPSGSTYGYRVINAVRIPGQTGSYQISPQGSTVYGYQQTDPLTTQLPDAAVRFDQWYGKILIDNVIYRIWKSGDLDENTVLNVYSIP